MTTSRRASKNKPAHSEVGPVAGRPHIPVAGTSKGLLPWSHVAERMAQAMHYWVCTVSPNGRPHVTMLDGLWLDNQLFFGGSPQTRRTRNLAANPAVCIHLGSGADVVILYGDAHLRTPDHPLAVRLADASAKKYGEAPNIRACLEPDSQDSWIPRA